MLILLVFTAVITGLSAVIQTLDLTNTPKEYVNAKTIAIIICITISACYSIAILNKWEL